MSYVNMLNHKVKFPRLQCIGVLSLCSFVYLSVLFELTKVEVCGIALMYNLADVCNA